MASTSPTTAPIRSTLIPIADIDVGERHRKVTPESVQNMAAWITRDGGMKTPITVTSYTTDKGDERYKLVTGNNRLQAGKLLEWKMITAFIDDLDEIEAEEWEIAENFHRTDLGPEEKSAHWDRLVELEEQRLQSGQGDPIESKRADGRGHRPKGAIANVAKEHGVSESTVKRHVKRAKAKPGNASAGAGLPKPKAEKQPKRLGEAARAIKVATDNVQKAQAELAEAVRKLAQTYADAAHLDADELGTELDAISIAYGPAKRLELMLLIANDLDNAEFHLPQWCEWEPPLDRAVEKWGI